MTVTFNELTNTVSIVDTAETGYYFLHILAKITTEETTVSTSNITRATSSLSITTDGLYQVISIKLPETTSTIDEYYTNGTNIYQYDSVEIIPVSSMLTYSEKTTQYVFSKFVVYNNLIETEKDILDLLYDCKSDPIKTRYRDILYMGLSVIQYLLDNSLYNEANRLIEKLQSCSTTTSTCNCR